MEIFFLLQQPSECPGCETCRSSSRRVRQVFALRASRPVDPVSGSPILDVELVSIQQFFTLDYSLTVDRSGCKGSLHQAPVYASLSAPQRRSG